MDKNPVKVYFCGSIRGGRADLLVYQKLISFLKLYGTVLTEHIGEKEILTDLHLSGEEIYQRDMEWMTQADFVVAEVSTPSLGVGFEIAKAIGLNKKILCLSQAKNNQNLSAMISGCPDLQIVLYSGINEAKSAINNFMTE